MRKPKFKPVRVGCRWVLNIPATVSGNGKRKRFYFNNEEDAKRMADEYSSLNTTSISTAITKTEYKDAYAAISLLKSKNLYYENSLSDIVSSHIAVISLDEDVTLEEVLYRYIREKNSSLNYAAALRQMLNRLSGISDEYVSMIDDHMITESLKPFTDSVIDLYCRQLSTLFNFSVKKKWCHANPIPDVLESIFQDNNNLF